MVTVQVAVDPFRVALVDSESVSWPVRSTTVTFASHAIVVLVEIAEVIVIVKLTTIFPV
jgi:hypothetical protein